MTQVPYGSGPEPTAVSLIDGHAGRTLGNAMTLTLTEDGRALGVATQGAGGGVATRLGVLFGFKNNDATVAELAVAGGPTLVIPTRDSQPTLLAHDDGTAVATITRGPSSLAAAPDGSTVLTITDDADEPDTIDRYRLQVVDGTGARLARLDVVKTRTGWDPDTVTEALVDVLLASNVSTNSLTSAFLGTRLALFRTPTAVERDVLLAVCVEIVVSARPYSTSMGAKP